MLVLLIFWFKNPRGLKAKNEGFIQGIIAGSLRPPLSQGSVTSSSHSASHSLETGRPPYLELGVSHLSHHSQKERLCLTVLSTLQG